MRARQEILERNELRYEVSILKQAIRSLKDDLRECRKQRDLAETKLKEYKR